MGKNKFAEYISPPKQININYDVQMLENLRGALIHEIHNMLYRRLKVLCETTDLT